ncbi:Cwf19-like, C-terminal domain-1 [Dillenia turbinata]|uniref:Cwf19-like, C-terminal domain-1 n=1 Tax=Dillenia turbinata TaxID=194707 RepID=A0AAN8YV87_9MAGN
MRAYSGGFGYGVHWRFDLLFIVLLVVVFSSLYRNAIIVTVGWLDLVVSMMSLNFFVGVANNCKHILWTVYLIVTDVILEANPGTMVILRNAKIDMFKGTMRLAVDKWGRVEVTKSATFAIKEDNNLSLVEYELPPGLPFGTYSQDDVDALRALMGEPGIIDSFLRCPCAWLRHSLNLSYYETGTDSTISELVAEMKTRSSIIGYHIADTKDIYYACERYSNVDVVHGTRFLGLASVRNRDKQKFIHALSPTQASSMTTAEIFLKPPNTASCPYNVIEKTTHTKEAAEHPGASISDLQYWRYDASQKWQKHEEDGNKLIMSMGGKCRFWHGVDARDQFLRGVCYHFINKGKCERCPGCSYKRSLQDEGESMSTKRSRADSARSNSFKTLDSLKIVCCICAPSVEHSEGFSLHGFFKSKGCWFCLLRPSVGLHLLISIGENYYCTLAKGPLVQVQGHDSLRMCFKNQGKEVIFIEWIQKRATHAKLQTNSSEGRRLLKSQFDKEHSFFYVELPDCTMLSHCMEENENFPAINHNGM